MEATKSIIVGTPHNRDLTPEYVTSIIVLLRTAPYQVGVAFYQSCLVNVGRNTIAQGVVNSNTDYLLFVDSDMEFPPWGLERLLSHDKDIVGGLYFKKGKPHFPLVYNFKEWTHEAIKNPPTELFECDGIGTGFLLIKRQVLVDLFDKDFATKNGFPFNFIQKPDGNEIGEDLAFCHRAKQLGYKIWCDPSIPLKHIGDGEAYSSKDYYEGMKSLAIIDALPYDNQIEGWMSKEELNWLNRVAKTVDTVIEIGSWKGRSTHALLDAGAKVTAIDHFKGSNEPAHEGINPYDDFVKNVGHFSNLTTMKMSSEEASEKFEGKADMVFIDGGHTYEDVKKDIELWLPKATKIICGHDFQWEGVQKAVTEKFGFVHTIDTIWYVKLGE